LSSQQSVFSAVVVREGDKHIFTTLHNLTAVTAEDTAIINEEIPIHIPQTTEKLGDYKISLYQVFRGGISGTYYSDLMMFSDMKVMERIDKAINLTWSRSDQWSSIHWKGFIMDPGITEKCCLFHVKGDNVRLWIDQFLVIDEWSGDVTTPLTFSFTAFHDLAAFGNGDNHLHEITLQVRQTDRAERHDVSLSWNASGSMKVVDSSYLYAKAS
jgi:hypothetical protein